jgi:transposase-like protein
MAQRERWFVSREFKARAVELVCQKGKSVK